MKIVLIPGMTAGLKRTDASKTTMSLGVLALAASLEETGYQTDIFDMDYFIEHNKIEINYDLYKQAARHLVDTEAQIFGIYVAVGTLHHAVNLSKEIKNLNHKCIVFFGGPHATAVHDEIVLNFSHVDYVLRGECDTIIVDFISALQSSSKEKINFVNNITYLNENGQLKINEERPLISNLDDLPIPAYYKHKTEHDVLDIIPMDVGRGCPYNCTFCSTSVFWKKSYRSKSIDRILKEMEYIKELFNAQKVFLMHDCLTADKKTLLKICNAIRESDIQLEWGCAARLDHLDIDTLKILKESNCTHLEIGIESGSELVRTSINKKLDSDGEVLLNKLQCIHDMGFSLVLFFICGFANEREEDIRATLNMIRDSLNIMKGNGFFRLTYLELFAGTKLYQDEKEKAVFSPFLLDDISIKLYTKEQLEIARTTNLFPEFYYVSNTHIDPKYFRELSSVYSSFIKVLGTEFYLTFSILLECFQNDIHQFFITWRNFERGKNCLLRESHMITDNLLDYIDFVSSSYILPMYFKELVEYELMVYGCRQNFLYKNTNNFNGTNGCPLFINATIKDFSYDIPHIINELKSHKDSATFEKATNTIYLLTYMVSSEKISVIKINKEINDVLMICNGNHSTDEIIDLLCETRSQDINKTQLKNDVMNLLLQFEQMHLLKNIGE